MKTIFLYSYLRNKLELVLRNILYSSSIII